MPDLRYIVVPHPIGGIREDAVAEKARASVPDLLASLTPEPVPDRRRRPMTTGGTPGLGDPAALVELPADPGALHDAFAERGWSDGLPVIAPTEERVEAMLAYTDRDRREVLGVLPPRRGVADGRGGGDQRRARGLRAARAAGTAGGGAGHRASRSSTSAASTPRRTPARCWCS